MEPFGAAYRPHRHAADAGRRSGRAGRGGSAERPVVLGGVVEPLAARLQHQRACRLWRASVRNDDLQEWDYGAYEGRTTKEILAERPGWNVFRDGCPQGETAADVGARADRVIRQLREAGGSILIFSSAHFLRVLTARWLGLPPEGGALFVLDTASISVLGYEHDLSEPVVRKWNQK